MSGKVKVLISEERVMDKVAELGRQITLDYIGKTVHLICILKGSVMFMSDLSKKIDLPVTMDFMAVSSYGDDTKSSGVVKIIKDLDENITGKDVLIVEDIVDSGRTLSYLKQILLDRKPNSLKICALLDKPDRRVDSVDIAYIGFTIPDNFVIGYGLDYQQKYRNLPFVGEMTEID